MTEYKFELIIEADNKQKACDKANDLQDYLIISWPQLKIGKLIEED